MNNLRSYINLVNEMSAAAVSKLKTDIKQQVDKTDDAELLDRIYTVLNKSSLSGRISNILNRDTDTKGFVDMITNIIIDTPGTYQEKFDFIDGFPTGYVDVKKMLGGDRVKFEDLLTGSEFVQKVFDRLKRETFGTAKGPGEFALAVMSPHIKITGKGDLNIGDMAIEVKASAGKEVSSGGGRLGTPGSLHSDNVQQIIEKNLKVKFADAVPGGNLGLGGLSKLSADLSSAERTAFGKELFGYIFHGTANINELVSTFANNGDLRDSWIKANYESYKNETSFDGVMIMNFALGELHYFKDVSDLVKHVYNAIGVYLVSKDKAAQARQILTQVTLAPFKEPPVVVPTATPDAKNTEYQQQVTDFATRLAAKNKITDQHVIGKIVHMTTDALQQGVQPDKILKLLKSEIPELNPVAPASATPSAAKPMPAAVPPAQPQQAQTPVAEAKLFGRRRRA